MGIKVAFKNMKTKDLEKVIDRENSNFRVEGDIRNHYDNLNTFLGRKGVNVYYYEDEKARKAKNKGEGLYCHIFHFKGCTIRLDCNFEFGNTYMEAGIYGNGAKKVCDELFKLGDVDL